MVSIPIGCAGPKRKPNYDVTEEDAAKAQAIIRVLIDLPEGQTWEVQRDEQGQLVKHLGQWAVFISTEGAVVLATGTTARYRALTGNTLERFIVLHFPILNPPTMHERYIQDGYAYFGGTPNRFYLHREITKSKMFDLDYDFVLQAVEHKTGNISDFRPRHLEPLRIAADNSAFHRTRGRVSRSLLSIITLNTCTLLFSYIHLSFVLIEHLPRWKCTSQCTSWILGSP